MKRSLLGCSCAVLLFAGPAFEAIGKTELLPGLVFYGSADDLAGRLAFLATPKELKQTEPPVSASIYEFDLPSKTLRRITDSPAGMLVASETGDLFCVVAPEATAGRQGCFLYSRLLKRSLTIVLEGPPLRTVLIAQHAFFLITDRHYVVDFNFETQNKTFIGWHKDSAWGRGYVDGISQNTAATGGPDTLHFAYWQPSAGMGGPVHESGFYDLDLRSGTIRPSIEDYSLDVSFPACNGQFVYFKGRDSPVRGSVLAISPWEDDQSALREDPHGERTKVLHKFAGWSLTRWGCSLDRMSPDRKYALVTRPELRGGRTFYAVNVATGKTQVLLKDKGSANDPYRMNPLWWLP
jgi:hypothetical protein